MFLPENNGVGSRRQGQALRGNVSIGLPNDPSGGHEPGGFVGPGAGDMTSPSRRAARPPINPGGGEGSPGMGTPVTQKPTQPKEDPYAAARWRKEHPWLFPGSGGGAPAPPPAQTAMPAPTPAPAPTLPPAVVMPRMEGFGMDGARGMIGRY